MTARSALLALALAAAGPLAGCKRPALVGHFGEAGFYHARDHYRVRYLRGDAAEPRAQRRLLPASWEIENFDVDAAGRPTRARAERRFWSFYLVQGGHLDGRERGERAPRLDLLYRDREAGGLLWVRTLPLDDRWRGEELRSLLRASVESIGTDDAAPDLLGRPTASDRAASDRAASDRAASDRAATDRAATDAATGVVQRSASLRAEGPARVDGQPGRYVSFDVSTRPAGGGPAHTERVTVVALRPRDHAWRIGGRAFPVLLVAGHVSPVEQHARQSADFESLVERLDVAPPRR